MIFSPCLTEADFGVGRDFGYKRQHLGHDMMGLIGTPTEI